MEFLSTLELAVEATKDIPAWLVCVLGVSVVFVGLICIIAILYLMNFIISKGGSKKTEKAVVTASPVVAASAEAPATPIENRREIIAAVCAAVAEEEGTDISAIRVISFKKL